MDVLGVCVVCMWCVVCGCCVRGLVHVCVCVVCVCSGCLGRVVCMWGVLCTVGCVCVCVSDHLEVSAVNTVADGSRPFCAGLRAQLCDYKAPWLVPLGGRALPGRLPGRSQGQRVAPQRAPGQRSSPWSRRPARGRKQSRPGRRLLTVPRAGSCFGCRLLV